MIKAVLAMQTDAYSLLRWTIVTGPKFFAVFSVLCELRDPEQSLWLPIENI